LTILAAGIFLLTVPLRLEERKIAAVENTLRARRPEVNRILAIQQDLENRKGEVATVEGFKNARPPMITLLKGLTEIIPKNAWITRVKIDEEGVDLEGYAVSASEMLPRLEAARQFRKVEYSSPTVRDARTNMERFTIRMEVAETKEAKPGS
ncbi:MAG: PilN domain-containing protein, partial [Smithellaceae bacterium]|nr:PilN domain-containing protein [Smithellaceae bacterium]